MSTKSIRIIEYSAPLAIFLFFTSTFLVIHFSGSQFSSSDDPAYHLAHARSYITEMPWTYPIYSTFATHPVDLYYLYHVAQSVFIRMFDLTDAGLIAATKLFHSILAGLVFSVLFSITRALIVKEGGESVRVRAFLWSLISIFVLFAMYPGFTFRLYLYRPHLISIILVLLSMYFTVRKKSIGVALVSFIAPYFYSIAFLVSIPPLFYAFTNAVYRLSGKKFATVHERIKAFWRNLLTSDPETGKRAWSMLAISLCALGIGIFSRPDSFNYLYNGFYLELKVLFNFFFNDVDRIGELVSASAPVVWAYVFVLTFVAIVFISYVQLFQHGLRRVFSRERFFVFCLSQFFFIVMVLIGRASEYAAPLMVLYMTWIFVIAVVPFIERVQDRGYQKMARNPVAAELLDAAQGFIESVITHQRKLLALVALVGGVTFVGVVLVFTSLLRAEPPVDLFKGAATYLAEHSNEGDVVFQQYFDSYPRLVYYNQKNRYIAGISETFTHEYDEALYWQWRHIARGEPICATRLCEGNGADMYETLQNIFKAKFIFIETLSSAHRGELQDATKHFIKKLDSDARFTKVYTDPKYRGITVYKL